MAVLKRLLIVLGLAVTPLLVGLLFTYDIIKIEWISFMEIQPSFRTQEDPLPLPARSVPIQGAAYIPELGAPINPIPADEASLQRGKTQYEINCQICHGATGRGNGPFAVFLQPRKPVSLLEGRPVTLSDGELFMTITNGVEGAMPSLIQNLPEPQMRWDVVNYVRSLQKQANP
ncbi:cytochrome c [Anaerolinea sp.]|uniref:c-type cytochrome n=1 Tax=Anaerolinea sp. TaxID=1872519 RepID=UPI002ACE175A|nr:cytochrome c [Anaerolinea sp.]